MSPPPRRPKVYHITHVDNLAPIVAESHLVCDREMVRRGGPAKTIGMSSIKRRRVEELPVDCHPETKVGDYVPFYFCPRSVMLNAGSRYAAFRNRVNELDALDWDAIRNRIFRDREVREAKQAEFLVHETVPFGLFDRIGARSQAVLDRAEAAVQGLDPRPAIEIRAQWYY